MAHTLHERTITYLESNEEGRRQVIISSRPLLEVARGRANGRTTFELVTEIHRWRGKNGKIKVEEISRTPVTV